MNLYIARFKNEVYAPNPNFKERDSYQQQYKEFFAKFCSIERFEIVFDISKLIDRDQYTLLVKRADGFIEWQGPWAPHSPYTSTKENAVQMLRWWNIFTDEQLLQLVGAAFKKRAKNAYLRRVSACENWLKENNTKIIEPWWIEPLSEKIWV